MRPWVFALLAVAPAAVVWLSLSGERAPPQASRAPVNEDAFARARIARLEAEVERLRGDLDRARSDLSAVILSTAPPQGPEG